MSEISLKCEIWHRIAKIWDRQKFRILAEISAILAPYGAFSQKMSENVEKCIFSKLTEINWFFIFSLKIIILKSFFCMRIWISTKEIWITFVKKKLS